MELTDMQQPTSREPAHTGAAVTPRNSKYVVADGENQQEAMAMLPSQQAEGGSAAQALQQTECHQRISSLSKWRQPRHYLRVEGGLSLLAGIVKIGAGIALSVFGAINALVGQFIGGVASIAIGVMKFMRAQAMSKISANTGYLIKQYEDLCKRYKAAKGGDQIAQLDQDKAALDSRDQAVTEENGTLKKRINVLRLTESIAGVFSGIGGLITGSIFAIGGLSANLVKMGRAIYQLKSDAPSPKLLRALIMIESFTAGLTSLFALNAAADGISELKADPLHKLIPAGEASSAATLTKTVAGTTAASAGLATAGVKAGRGYNTPAAGKDGKAKAGLKTAIKEQVASAKALNSSARQVNRAAMKETTV